MEKLRPLIICLIIIALATLVVLMLEGCSKTNFKYKEDNMAEEILEEVIKNKTGIDVDLTPSTPE